MTYDTNNVFAKILRGEIPCDKVYENEHALAFNDIQPQSPVHVLVIPKGAYVNYDDFSSNASDEEIGGFIRAVGEAARMAGVAESKGGAGYRLITNAGPDARQEVAHFHVHICGGGRLGRMLPKSSGNGNGH